MIEMTKSGYEKSFEETRGGSLFSGIRLESGGESVNWFFVFGVSVLVLILAFWGAEIFYQKKKDGLSRSLSQDLLAKKTNLSNLQSDERYVDFPVQLNATKKLLANHVYLSAVFPFLSDITLKNVQWTSMSFDNAAGQLSLEGRAPNSAVYVEQVLVFLKSDKLKNVSYAEPTYGEGEVSFSLVLDIKPSLILNNEN